MSRGYSDIPVEMSLLMKINHCHHAANFENLDQIEVGGTMKIIALNGSVQVHRVMIGAFSQFLRSTINSIPISELDNLFIPDVDISTINQMLAFLYSGTLLCSKEEYENIMELLLILGIDCSDEQLIFTYSDGSFADFAADYDEIEPDTFLEEPNDDMFIGCEDSTDCFQSDVEALLVDTNSQSDELTINGVIDEIKLNGEIEITNIVKKEPPSGIVKRERNTTGNLSRATFLLSHRCSECGKSFSTVGKLKRHKSRHQNQTEQQVDQDDSTLELPFTDPNVQKRVYKCRRCSFKSSNRSFFIKHHMTNHAGQKTLNCSLCNKVFTKDRNLKAHFGAVHSDKKFQCDLCDFKTTRSDSLKRHVHTVHMKAHLNCAFCGLPFTSGWLLRQHINAEHGECITTQQFSDNR